MVILNETVSAKAWSLYKAWDEFHGELTTVDGVRTMKLKHLFQAALFDYGTRCQVVMSNMILAGRQLGKHVPAIQAAP